MTQSPDNQINASFIDISRIKWLVLLLRSPLYRTTSTVVNSFIDGSGFCPGPPNRVPSDSEKHLRVYTSFCTMSRPHVWRVDTATRVACWHGPRQNLQKTECVLRRLSISGWKKNCGFPSGMQGFETKEELSPKLSSIDTTKEESAGKDTHLLSGNGKEKIRDLKSDHIRSGGEQSETDVEKRFEAEIVSQNHEDSKLITQTIKRECSSNEYSATSLGKDGKKRLCQVDLDVNSKKLSSPDVSLQCTTKMDATDAIISLQSTGDDIISESIPEVEDVADISLNPGCYDTLSCSASPCLGSLLSDPENSCHSDKDYHNDQVFCKEGSDLRGHDIPSETCDLSEGEIGSSSDSEISTNIKETRKSDRATNKQPTRDRSKSSHKRSQKEDKHFSSQRSDVRGHKPSRSRDRHSMNHDREKFFEKKMKILEERQQSREFLERRHSDSSRGGKSTNDQVRGPHSSNRKRLTSMERISPEKRRTVEETAPESRGRREKDQRAVKSRAIDSVARSSRHPDPTQSTRRHDRDHHERSGMKQERRMQTSEKQNRHKSSRNHRR